MSEMTPDPVYDALARFTPDVTAVDPAAILFAAGRASARTPIAWKLAVAGLALANLGLVCWFALRAPESAAVIAPEPVVVPVVVPVPVPLSEPSGEVPYAVPSPWSFGTLNRVTDPEELPGPAVSTNAQVVSSPLTPYAARRGVLD